jgi:hypothetical protein
MRRRSSRFRIERNEQIRPVLARALEAEGPVMIDLRVDYSGNAMLMERRYPFTRIEGAAGAWNVRFNRTYVRAPASVTR